MIGGGNIRDGVGDNELFCDTKADAVDLPQFAVDHNLKMGQTCLCIETSEVYCLKSDGTWSII